MPRYRPILLAAVVACPVLSVAAAPRQAETLCFGLPATIADHSGEIVGTPGDDVIIGDDGRNVIYGEGGADMVCGNGGADEIETDCVNFESVGARIDGGPGDDEIDACGDGPIDVLGGPGDDWIDSYGHVGGTIDGGSGDDHIYGSAPWDGGTGQTLRGGPGNDLIRADDGDDTIVGEDGADQLYGNDGSDTLDGGTSTHPEKKRIKKKNGKVKKKTVQVIDSDLCQVGPGGGTATNCEREV